MDSTFAAIFGICCWIVCYASIRHNFAPWLKYLGSCDAWNSSESSFGPEKADHKKFSEDIYGYLGDFTKAGVLFNDLHAGNLIVCKDKVKMLDFDQAEVTDDPGKRTDSQKWFQRMMYIEVRHFKSVIGPESCIHIHRPLHNRHVGHCRARLLCRSLQVAVDIF